MMEFRVRWRREGRGQGTRVYQTWEAAWKRYCTIKCWDDVKEGSRYADMPDLEFVVLESREVPAWEPHPFQPDVRARMRLVSTGSSTIRGRNGRRSPTCRAA
jgi:hypothetical protein